MTETIVILALLGLLLLWLRFRNPRPEFPPLEIGNEHPKIQAAVDEARRTLPEFRERVSSSTDGCLVKFALTTSTDSLEHVWAEVLEAEWPELRVRIVTPPVTHEGVLERVRDVTENDLEDWQITEAGGSIRGGFTQRAMFEVAREEWGGLPRKLEKFERLYRPDR